jgi:hypothetical protein
MRHLIAVALLAALSLAASGEAGQARRFALVAGCNIGGKSTTDLKYAADDAKRMRDVLVRIGGFREEDTMLLINPEKESLANGLKYIGQKMRQAASGGSDSPDAQLLFYYSGHSDERGLLLFGEYFRYGDLKASLDGLDARVRLVILDSCSSGAFTRPKGGDIAAPFLVGGSDSVEGHAYLMSSAAEELSQESDMIRSSFFSHYLVSGLRGAADANGDGKITLSEAYDYAYDMTLRDTERSRAGSQHPAFDIELNGMGSLVLTDLSRGEASIRVPREMAGRFSVRDASGGLVAELRKSDDKAIAISVEQGYYKVLRENGGELSEASVIVDEKMEYALSRDSFKGVSRFASATRGIGDGGISFFPVGLRATGDDGATVAYASLFGGVAGRLEGFMGCLAYGRAVGAAKGFQGTLFASVADSSFAGMQGSLGVAIAGGDLFGFQSSVFYSAVGENLSGIQLSVVNRVRGNARFGQIGGVNIVQGEGSFFQLGGANYSGGIRGLQAGLANLGLDVEGAQAGAVNYSRKQRGVQVGLINFSEDMTGVQVGLINVSKNLVGVPLGILDIQMNGENHIDAVFSPTSLSGGTELLESMYFRLGSRYFYKYMDVGRLALKREPDSGFPVYHVGFGIGLRVPLFFDGFALHLDGGANYQSLRNSIELVEDPTFWQKVVPQIRLFATCKLYKGFGLVAGMEQWIYTEDFHRIPEGAGDFSILTGYGRLVVDARLFAGIQM